MAIALGEAEHEPAKGVGVMAPRHHAVREEGIDRLALLRAAFIVASAAILLMSLPLMVALYIVALFTGMWQPLYISAVVLALASAIAAAGLSAGGD
jgi:hypothetical protein